MCDDGGVSHYVLQLIIGCRTSGAAANNIPSLFLAATIGAKQSGGNFDDSPRAAALSISNLHQSVSLATTAASGATNEANATDLLFGRCLARKGTTRIQRVVGHRTHAQVATHR